MSEKWFKKKHIWQIDIEYFSKDKFGFKSRLPVPYLPPDGSFSQSDEVSLLSCEAIGTYYPH